MGFRVVEDAGVFSIEFFDEPDYCHALPPAPFLIDDMLNSGPWLVLLPAVWSLPDRRSIDLALNFAKRAGGRFNLGVRIFDDYQESYEFCPEIKDEFASPFWLYFEDGLLVKQWFAIFEEGRLKQEIEAFLLSRSVIFSS